MNTASFPRRTAAFGALAATALAFAAATSPAAAATPEAEPVSILVDCARPALPSQQDITRLTGAANFSQAYALRARLMGEAKRACHSASKVRLVLEPAQADRALAVR